MRRWRSWVREEENRSSLRYVFLRHLSFALTAALLALWPAAAQPGISLQARAAWGFDRSDLQPHPRVRFGLLPNGMRYALMRNDAPKGALSVRLRFDFGAKMEGRREQGFAHLIEHMIFHGTPNIPHGSLPLMLAHRGMRHWSDINAFTSFDETVYRLDMTRADAPAREAALLVMHEIATNLQFTRKTVAGAKRDVQDEIGARDGVEDAMQSAQNAFFFPGTTIDRGPVAGTRRDVGRATPEALQRLYELHYTPRRATLVMVGDFDPAAVEAEIVSRFSAWPSGGAAVQEPPSVSLPTRRAEAHLFVHGQAPTTVTIATVAPIGGTDAGGRRDAHFLEHIGAQMLNRRLARLAARADAPFRRADLAIYDHYGTGRLARIEVEARERDWKGALQGSAAALASAARQGFSQAELDEQIAASRRGPPAQAAPTTSPALADAIVDAVNRRIVFTAPADPAGTDAYLARLRLDDVNAAFRAVWARSGPLIFVSNHHRIEGAEAAILEIWRHASLAS